MSTLKNDLLKTLKLKFKADKQDALARLRLYTERPAGIGEHPQITEEMAKLVEQYSSAQDNLDNLKVIKKSLK